LPVPDAAVPPSPAPVGPAEAAPARKASTIVRVARYGSIAAAAVLAVGLFVQLRNDSAFTGPDFEVASAPPSEAPPSEAPPGSAPTDAAAPESPPPPPPPAAPVGGGSGGSPAPSTPTSGRTTGRAAGGRPGGRPGGLPPAPSAPVTTARRGGSGAFPGPRSNDQPAAQPDRVERPSGTVGARPGIEAAVRGYERGFAARDVAALRRVWLVPEQDAARLEALFRDARDVTVAVRIVDIPTLTDTRAVVSVDETRTVRPARGTAARTETRRRTFHLEKRPSGWIIVAIAD
jgi:hypothetical protein